MSSSSEIQWVEGIGWSGSGSDQFGSEVVRFGSGSKDIGIEGIGWSGSDRFGSETVPFGSETAQFGSETVVFGSDSKDTGIE